MPNKMSISMQYELRDDYLFVRCEGPFDFESMRQVYARSFAAAVEAGRKALLIDVTAFTGEPPTIFERYKLGTYVAELQRGPGRGVLIAGVGKQPMVHAQKFGELVARNRAAMARIFTDTNDAVAWIRASLSRKATRSS